MPLTKLAPDAFGVVTICLVLLLVFLGLLCILYSFYFHSRVRRQGFLRLSYFSGPWVIRIIFVLFVIWWGLWEVIRLSLLRREGRPLSALSVKWQENVCKCYIISNLGFAEPCIFLILIFLLRAPLQSMDSGTLGGKWNGRTLGYVLVYCLPVFVLQLLVTLVGPRIKRDNRSLRRLPHYFTNTSSPLIDDHGIALCMYPLLSTILLGLFSIILTLYLCWVGRRILKRVINKCLQKRVYTLILSVSSFLPLRAVLLGLSVLSQPEEVLFEALAFAAFLALSSCAGVCIFMLVYFPVADSLALRNLQDPEPIRTRDDPSDTLSLIANQSHPEGSSVRISPGGDSGSSSKRGSISFRTTEKQGTSPGTFVELSLFSPSRDATPPGSPRPLGWPMRSPPQAQGP